MATRPSTALVVDHAGDAGQLVEGARGPDRTVVASNAAGMAWRQAKELTPADVGWPAGWAMPDQHEPTMRDEPLFEEIEER